MNRYLPIGGAIISGLCLFVAVQQAVFFLVWIALVPLLVPLLTQRHPTPFRAGLIMGAALAGCAFAWMVPGIHAFTGLSYGYGFILFLVCVTLFAIGCATVLWMSFRLPHPVFMACIWALAETGLQWVADSLPWFLFHMGNALSANLVAIQPASVTGVTGLSFIVVLVNGFIAKAIVHHSYKRLLLPCFLFIVYMCWGWWLLVSFDRSVENTAAQPTFRLSILQQNIPPDIQWDQANGNALVQQLLQEERRCLAQKPNLILWSESAIPWTYSPQDDLVKELLRTDASAQVTHMLGMNTAITDNVVGNSAYCLLPGGQLAGRYDKRTPLLLIEQPWNGWLLPFFSANGYSVQAGKNNLPLSTPYGKAGILICNESVLPQAAATTILQGAQFLLNLSNDGWFKNTYLVRSHFYNARLRAVETRKDLAINSNNGQCGLVAASGRITNEDLVTIHPNTIQTIAVRYPAPVCLFLFIASYHNHYHTPENQINMRSKKLWVLGLLLFSISSEVAANFSQAHWRWRKDNASENHASWLSPQDFPTTLPFTAGVPLRLRIEVYNSLVNTESGIVTLQYQRGPAGAWTTISNTAAGRDFVMAGSSVYVTDKQPITSQIRDDGAGTFTGGKVLVSTWQFTDTVNAGARKEYEWCIKPTSSLSKDSIYQFRLLFSGTQDALGYVSPVPDMMYRTNTPIPGNAGIYKDPLVTGFFDRKTGWIASDGGFSIPLSDGRNLWSMNDSYIDHLDTMTGTTPCLFQVRNAAMVQPMGNWNPTATTTRIGTGPGIPSLFKNNPDDNYLLWPTSGYQYGDTVYVYCSNIKNSSEGLGFTRGGNDFIGKMAMPGLAVTGFDALQSFNDITFGIGFYTEEPGNYIYTWGVQGAFITSNIVVARFPKNNPRAHWSFWNGSAWDTAIAHIAPVSTGASNGIFVAKVRNKYVLVSTEFSVSCDAGTRIYVATSNSITGPFTDRKVLYTIPDNELGHTPFFYSPAIHSEYINANNELLITYAINCYSNCLPSCINNGFNPDYYRPRGIRVPLARIDSSISLTGKHSGIIPPHGCGLTVYPNPTRSSITVSVAGFTGKQANLVLRNTRGQVVYTNSLAVSSPAATLTMNLPARVGRGTYFLQVQNETFNQVTRVLLQ